MSEAERLQAAQALIAEIAKKYGVTVSVSNQIKRVEDGSVIVTPSVLLTLIEGWKAE